MRIENSYFYKHRADMSWKSSEMGPPGNSIIMINFEIVKFIKRECE